MQKLLCKYIYFIAPTPRTFLDPDVSRGIIGEAIDIVCTVTITSTVDLNLVNLNWVGDYKF